MKLIQLSSIGYIITNEDDFIIGAFKEKAEAREVYMDYVENKR